MTVLFPTQGELDRERFSTDLWRSVEMDTAYKADLRMFVSKGQTCFCYSQSSSALKNCLQVHVVGFFFRDADLRVSGCYGLFIPGPDPGHVTMATMNQFTTQAVELAHSRGLDETRGVTIQVDISVKLPRYHFDCSCLKCKAV